MRLDTRVMLFENDERSVRFGFGGALWSPTGNPDAFTGDDAVAGMLYGSGEVDFKKWFLTGMMGPQFRTERSIGGVNGNLYTDKNGNVNSYNNATGSWNKYGSSGWQTAALTIRLMVTGGMPLAAGYIGAGGEVTWTKPVYAGDTLTVRVEVREVKPSGSRPDRGFALLRCETRNQRDEVVQVLQARVMVPRRQVP